MAEIISLDFRGAYPNLEAGFDAAHNRKCIFNASMIPNIKENPLSRKTPKRGRKRFFNAAIHALWTRVVGPLRGKISSSGSSYVLNRVNSGTMT